MKNIQNKKIALLGLGLDNYALLKFITKHDKKLPITVLDPHDKKTLIKKFPDLKKYKNISYNSAKQNISLYKHYDIIYKSPGAFFPLTLRKKLTKNNTLVSSAIDLFFELTLSKNIIGVTGTKGKGSTASLIAHIIKSSKKRVFLSGNIGSSPFDCIDKLKQDDWVVLELSSFQLQDMNHAPHISVLTNFSAEHLQAADPNNPNHHTSLSDYWQSKLRIAKLQSNTDVFIANEKLKSKIKKEKLKSKILYFAKSNLVSLLPGEHNKENIAAAELAAKQLDISDAVIARAIKTFKGLEHRLEKITEKNGIAYYNDSFATIPESTITALNSFTAPIILLAGGADKNNNFKTLAKLIKQKVKFIILFKGKGSDRLMTALTKVNFPKQKTALVGSMKDAMKRARRYAQRKDVILLSPACASFGVFKNYKDRGQQFKREALRR